jgi:hypothetical protein
MDPEIDLVADLNAEDDNGLGRSTLVDPPIRRGSGPGRCWLPATASAELRPGCSNRRGRPDPLQRPTGLPGQEPPPPRPNCALITYQSPLPRLSIVLEGGQRLGADDRGFQLARPDIEPLNLEHVE